MKPSFEFADAIASPFIQIRRRPLTVFAWGLMMTAMIAALYALMIPMVMNLPLDPDQSDVAAQAYMAETVRLQVVVNGMNVVMYGLMLLIWTATARATLSSASGDRFLFLRVGMDEVRVGVVAVGTFVGWYVALLILVVVGVLLGVGLWALNEALAVGVLMVYGLALFVATIWGWCRVSLMVPASMILKRFAFSEGWALARGQVWKLVGLNIVVWLLYMVLSLLILAVVGAILFGGFVGQGLRWPDFVETPADLAPLVSPMIVPALIATVPFAFAYGALVVLWSAPSVRAAQQLLEHPIPPPTTGDATTSDALKPSL